MRTTIYLFTREHLEHWQCNVCHRITPGNGWNNRDGVPTAFRAIRSTHSIVLTCWAQKWQGSAIMKSTYALVAATELYRSVQVVY